MAPAWPCGAAGSGTAAWHCGSRTGSTGGTRRSTDDCGRRCRRRAPEGAGPVADPSHPLLESSSQCNTLRTVLRLGRIRQVAEFAGVIGQVIELVLAARFE